MARLTFPNAEDRFVYTIEGASDIRPKVGAKVRIYSDSAGTVLADIQTLAGAAIANSELTVDANSLLPQFLGPDTGIDTLYAKGVGATSVTKIHSDVDSRLDSLILGTGFVLKEFLPLNVKDYGAIGDGVTDDTAAIQEVIDTIAALTYKPSLRFPAGDYLVTESLLITDRGYTFEGDYPGRPGTNAGTSITFSGVGELFKFGSDDGNAWDSDEYNGPRDQVFRNLYLRASAPITALDNLYDNYKLGTYGIRSWRAGNIRLENVWMQSFEYGFWGIQSDLNQWNNVIISECHRGIYLGPRSDQFTCETLYGNNNDVLLILDSCWGSRIKDLQSVGDGSPGKSAIILGASFARGQYRTVIEHGWLEHFIGQGGTDVQAFVQINPHLQLGGSTAYADDNSIRGITVDSPTILGSVAGPVKYLMEIGTNANRISLKDPDGATLINILTKVIHFINLCGADVLYESQRDQSINWDNVGTGDPSIHQRTFGYGTHLLTGATGILFLGKEPANPQRDMQIYAASDHEFRVTNPNDGSGNVTRLVRSTRWVEGGAAPGSLTWQQGDYVNNWSPTELGVAASKYVVLGWVCVAGGTPGTWRECRVLTGN